MNHPKHEDWVPYLFGEAKPEIRHQLRQHLQSCPECRAELTAWKRSLSRLDDWRLPKSSNTRTAPLQMVRWALASCAVLVLVAVFMLGRLTSTAATEARVRSELATQFRQELRSEMQQAVRDEVSRTVANALGASAQQTTALLTQYDQTVNARIETERRQRIADCLSLKKDVDTIAVNADAGLRDTETRLAQLADYRRPAASSN